MQNLINTPTTKKLLSLLLLFCFGHLSLLATDSKSIFDIMSYKEVLDVKMELDLNHLNNNRRSNEPIVALLSFEDENGVAYEWNIKAKVRGKFRRVKCQEIPPLKLDFSKKELGRMGLAQFDDMKLVNLCMEDGRQDKNYLLKEYLGYKLYNELTPSSFRVQLLRIHYVDQGTGEKKKQMGFIIEDTAQLRARLGAEKCEEERVIESERFDIPHRRMTAVFQYMIGNVDWAISQSKNTKYILKDGKIITVPYDFDFSALVSPGYASISAQYGQESIKDRVYLGFEKDRIELEGTIAFYESKKEDLLNVVDSFKLLPIKERKEIKTYLNSFFEENDTINFPVDKLRISQLD